jgi:RNA polymerase sigma-70 factor, ECF subfamily
MHTPPLPDGHPDFELLTLPLLARLRRYALRLAGSEAEADDLVQATYLNALRGWHTFQAGSDVARWMFTICRNTFFRSRRRVEDTVALDTPEVESLAGARAMGAAMTDGQAAWESLPDVGPAIDAAIGQLSLPLRVLVLLVDVEGYTYEEAARLEGVPIGTVRSRLYRARRMLQQSLSAYAADLGFGTTMSGGRSS